MAALQDGASISRLGRMFAVVITMALACGACAGSPEPADTRSIEQEEARLLVPYREKQTIYANEMEIEMTGNFYSLLAHGVTDTLHETLVEQREGNTIYVYQPKSVVAGGPRMKFQLEQTAFEVQSKMTVRVLGGANDFSLRTRAAGVLVVRGEATAEMAGVEINDGVFKRL